MRTVAVIGIKDGERTRRSRVRRAVRARRVGSRGDRHQSEVQQALGRPTLARVADLASAPDVIDVFRRSSAIPELADELLALPPALRAPVVWLQTGIRHDEAAERLVEGGYNVVQDRCLGVYRRRALRSYTARP